MAKSTSRFLALLRGINVGGRNIIPKQALAECFVDLGFENVRTYIQSGNILFRSSNTGVRELTSKIEAGLSRRFSYNARAVVLSERTYASAVRAAPAGWGQDDRRKHNALFTLATITPRKVLAQLPPPKPDDETVTTGPGVLFWSASKTRLSKTTMMKLASAPAFQHVTVRNHNTVYRLLELLDDI